MAAKIAFPGAKGCSVDDQQGPAFAGVKMTHDAYALSDATRERSNDRNDVAETA